MFKHLKQYLKMDYIIVEGFRCNICNAFEVFMDVCYICNKHLCYDCGEYCEGCGKYIACEKCSIKTKSPIGGTYKKCEYEFEKNENLPRRSYCYSCFTGVYSSLLRVNLCEIDEDHDISVFYKKLYDDPNYFEKIVNIHNLVVYDKNEPWI